MIFKIVLLVCSSLFNSQYLINFIEHLVLTLQRDTNVIKTQALLALWKYMVPWEDEHMCQ